MPGASRALVRRPSERLAEGIVTHRERRPVDVQLGAAQWAAYVSALESAGLAVVEAPPADDCPDGVFVEDTLVVLGGLAVITRPGAEPRRRETAGVEAAIRALGYPVERIEAPATLDGGDVLAVGDTIYVGTGGRTSPAGARALGELFDARIVEIPVAGVLHLKSAVGALPDGSIVGHPAVVPDPHRFPGFRPVPEESGGQVVLLGGNRILVSADCPRSAELFADLGFEPVVVDISELQALEGCVTCLSVLL